ncbi:MAG: pitrilysin family protein [Planctomycetota bacterium]|nr:pitrilysin family protein [Planctomycetota bacterium]
MNPITTITLSSGMTLVVEPMQGVRSAAIAFLTPAGFAADPEPRQGFAPLASELLMRGAGDLGSREHADALDRLGVGRSASAGAHFMSVGATLVGARLLEALPLLTNMVLRPRFEPQAFEPARELALAALESLKDEPTERVALAARARHLPSPLSRSGLGTEQGLTDATRDELAQHWATHALPERSIFAAAGAVDPVALRDRLEQLLSGWRGRAPAWNLGAPPERGYQHIEDPTNQVQILMMHDAPPESAPESWLEKVVVNVLSGGMSGRLFTEVREKRGLCYSVNASYRGDKEFGTCAAYVGTTPERAQDSFVVLLEQLRLINDSGITPDEFNRAITGMKSRLVFSSESTSARAAGLASDLHRLGRARTLVEIAAQIDAITLDQVNAYLKTRRLGSMTIQTLGPRPLRPDAVA